MELNTPAKTGSKAINYLIATLLVAVIAGLSSWLYFNSASEPVAEVPATTKSTVTDPVLTAGTTVDSSLADLDAELALIDEDIASTDDDVPTL